MSVPVMAAVAAGALLLGTPVLIASNAAVAGARAASAADAAVLAAADAATGFLAAAPVDPCALAAELAQLHGVTLNGCEFDPSTGEARVSVTSRVGVFAVSKSAHAGPP